jgi:hypothetical protein
LKKRGFLRFFLIGGVPSHLPSPRLRLLNFHSKPLGRQSLGFKQLPPLLTLRERTQLPEIEVRGAALLVWAPCLPRLSTLSPLGNPGRHSRRWCTGPVLSARLPKAGSGGRETTDYGRPRTHLSLASPPELSSPAIHSAQNPWPPNEQNASSPVINYVQNMSPPRRNDEPASFNSSYSFCYSLTGHVLLTLAARLLLTFSSFQFSCATEMKRKRAGNIDNSTNSVS